MNSLLASLDWTSSDIQNESIHLSTDVDNHNKGKGLQSEHVDIMKCLNIMRDFQERLKCYRKGSIHCDDCK